jgi:enolase-phosphatase E1
MLKYLFSLICLNGFASQVVLMDIEGTTTSLSFVHELLFPYAKKTMRAYVEKHQNDPEVRRILADVQEYAQIDDASLDQLIATLSLWMEQDRKITPLKSLQGMLWQAGYERGDFQGHVYRDVYEQLMRWKNENVSLYIYSSGSILSQKLLFSHTEYGDLTPLFSGYFDTGIGGKKEVSSYSAIANQMGLHTQDVLFLSDSLDELNAARAAGMETVLLCRNEAIPSDCPHDAVTSFTEIYFLSPG